MALLGTGFRPRQHIPGRLLGEAGFSPGTATFSSVLAFTSGEGGPPFLLVPRMTCPLHDLPQRLTLLPPGAREPIGNSLGFSCLSQRSGETRPRSRSQCVDSQVQGTHRDAETAWRAWLIPCLRTLVHLQVHWEMQLLCKAFPALPGCTPSPVGLSIPASSHKYLNWRPRLLLLDGVLLPLPSLWATFLFAGSR